MRAGVAILVGLLAACGSDGVVDETPTGPGNVDGKVNGREIVVQDAIAISESSGHVLILLSEQSESCKMFKDGYQFKEQSVLVFRLARTSSSEVLPMTSGSYQVLEYISMKSSTGGRWVEAGPIYVDHACEGSEWERALDGVVTLSDGFDKRTGKPIVGDFKLEFKSSSVLEGHFNATWCDIDSESTWDLDC